MKIYFFGDLFLFFLYEKEYMLIELNKILLLKPSEFKISISVESYDEKTTENDRYCYVAKKRIVFKLAKTSIPNFYITK